MSRPLTGSKRQPREDSQGLLTIWAYATSLDTEWTEIGISQLSSIKREPKKALFNPSTI